MSYDEVPDLTGASSTAGPKFQRYTLVLAAACTMVLVVVLAVLYKGALKAHKAQLRVAAQSQARMIEAVARYDAAAAEDRLAEDSSYDPDIATQSQVIEGLGRFHGFGETGEFALAQRRGQQIEFLYRQSRGERQFPGQVPIDSELAEPMRRALEGKSGTCRALDYRGEVVLAAYEPVDILDLGIVAKMDLSEVRGPFIRAGTIGALGTLLIIILGGWLFSRIKLPIIARLESHAQQLHQEMLNRKVAEVERSRLQEQLQQSQKLESMGRLAGGVAHDFNNMLGVILGHTEMALSREECSGVRSHLLEIQGAAERSADMTRQLLALARQQTVAPRVLDLNETIEAALGRLRMLVGESVQVTWSPSPDIGAIKVDPGQVEQVLANLCINARDALGGEGGIRVETLSTHVDPDLPNAASGLDAGEYVVLRVTDKGCGIKPELLEQIFEPFFTTKPVGKGTGLGLSLVQGVMLQNKGAVDVESHPGQGSVFSVYFPRSTEMLTLAATDREAPAPDAQHRTILVAEDEPAILNLAKVMLEKLGYTVLTAASPEEALRLAREHTSPIHLLLTDVIMPGMNGQELSARLQDLRPDLCTIFMSGYPADIIASQGVLDEGLGFIQKPFSMQNLSDVLALGARDGVES